MLQRRTRQCKETTTTTRRKRTRKKKKTRTRKKKENEGEEKREEEETPDYGDTAEGERQLALAEQPPANTPNIRYVQKEENVYRFSSEIYVMYLAGGGGWGEALAPTQGITWGEALLAFKSKSSERRKETLERRALQKRLRATVRLWASGNYSFEELD